MRLLAMALGEQSASAPAPAEPAAGRDLYVDFLRAGSLLVVAPMAYAAHRRAGPVAVVLLAGGSVLVDVARCNVLRDHVGVWAVRLSRSRPQRTSLEATASAATPRTTEGRM